MAKKKGRSERSLKLAVHTHRNNCHELGRRPNLSELVVQRQQLLFFPRLGGAPHRARGTAPLPASSRAGARAPSGSGLRWFGGTRARARQDVGDCTATYLPVRVRGGQGSYKAERGKAAGWYTGYTGSFLSLPGGLRRQAPHAPQVEGGGARGCRHLSHARARGGCCGQQHRPFTCSPTPFVFQKLVCARFDLSTSVCSGPHTPITRCWLTRLQSRARAGSALHPTQLNTPVALCITVLLLFYYTQT